MDGEVLHRHRGGDVPNVGQLLLADASRWAAHVFGLSVQGEKLWKTHARASSRKHISDSTRAQRVRWAGTGPGRVEPVFNVKDLLVLGANVSFLADFIVARDFFLEEKSLVNAL